MIKNFNTNLQLNKIYKRYNLNLFQQLLANKLNLTSLFAPYLSTAKLAKEDYRQTPQIFNL